MAAAARTTAAMSLPRQCVCEQARTSQLARTPWTALALNHLLAVRVVVVGELFARSMLRPARIQMSRPTIWL